MKLVSILNEELVFTGVKGVSRSGIYTDMLRRAQETLGLPLDVDQIVSAIIEREDALQMPYEGVALPHLRRPEFNDLYFIVGILPKPVQLQTIDPEQCRLVFMSLISPETSDLYLKSLAAFARFLGIGQNKQTLCSSASPAEFLSILNHADVKVRNNLTAEDLMITDAVPLKEDDTLAAAIDLFCRCDRSILPVVDGQGKLVGELSSLNILKQFTPEYMFRMDNLDFLNSFEPFNRIFSDEGNKFVRDFMREPELVVHPETPLIQFTVKMAKRGVNACFVVDAERRYIGEIMVKHLVKKVLRG